MNLLRITSLVSLTLLSSACNWAPLTTPGEKVRVLEPGEVKTCAKKGKTTVTTTAKVIGIPRGKDTVAEELINLARNIAPDLRGDTIVAISPIKDGKQTFAVYKCVDPRN